MLGTETAIATHSGKTELIIALTLLRVAQHLVGFCCFLEFLLSLLITRVLIWVILNRFLAIGFLYIICRGVFIHPKHFIVISFFCHNTLK